MESSTFKFLATVIVIFLLLAGGIGWLYHIGTAPCPAGTQEIAGWSTLGYIRMCDEIDK